MIESAVRGPMLLPDPAVGARFIADGILTADVDGMLVHVGSAAEILPSLPADVPIRVADGLILPPFIDAHIHIPQHPIRGRFVEGVPEDAPEGRLLAGLRKNVFPAEALCNDRAFAESVIRRFLEDTLSHGVVGGAAYMTPSPVATAAALEILPETWKVGLVLMNRNCPPDLCTDESTVDADMRRLARQFGPRFIVTDRFAVAVDSPLRRRASAVAREFGLQTQTHLNEQIAEKNFVENTLYPSAGSYTEVYHLDGLLDHRCILAHCIHMRDDEWKILRDTGSFVAHCPTSNAHLGSGTMPLDDLKRRGIEYAIATDVGASPTVSILAEMRRFLDVHRDVSTHATPAEALYRTTLAPARMLGLDRELGDLSPGRPMSFIEVASPPTAGSVDDVIRSILPDNPDHPAPTVLRVTMRGKVVFERKSAHA